MYNNHPATSKSNISEQPRAPASSTHAHRVGLRGGPLLARAAAHPRAEPLAVDVLQRFLGLRGDGHALRPVTSAVNMLD